MVGAAEVYTRERVYIREVVNAPGQPAVSLALARVVAGMTTEWHALNGVEERYIIVAGYGLMQIGRDSPRFPVVPGRVVVIAPGEAQRIFNPGPGDLLFECLCRPRFLAEHYLPLEGELD